MLTRERLTGTWQPPVTFPAPDSGPSLEIVVLHTDTKGTLRALKEATNLLQGMSAHIRLLVPQIVPYPLPVHSPDVSLAFTQRRFHAVAAGTRIETCVDIRLGREGRQLIESSLRPHSVVVMGARRRWWPTKETRLAKHLERMGHHVIFADGK